MNTRSNKKRKSVDSKKKTSIKQSSRPRSDNDTEDQTLIDHGCIEVINTIDNLNANNTNLRDITIDDTCDKCNSCPCDWVVYCEKIEEMTGYLFKEEVKNDKIVYYDKDGNEASNSFIRRSLYTSYTYLKLGNFGKDGKYKSLFFG